MSSPTSPATVIALTTTFTPPAPCATQFMQLEIDQNKIWMNPMTPVRGASATSCYPPEWLEIVSLQSAGTSGAALSPLVCPSGWQTQSSFASGYIACCPSGFEGLTLKSGAPNGRPAYGATCYTNIYGTPLLVTAYGSSSVTATSLYTATYTYAQAYAHVYDGYAMAASFASSTSKSASTSSPISSSSHGLSGDSAVASSASSRSSSASNSALGSSSSNGLSDGAIAGAVVGSIAGLVILLGVIYFLFLRRKRGTQIAGSLVEKGASDEQPNVLNELSADSRVLELPGNEHVVQELLAPELRETLDK